MPSGRGWRRDMVGLVRHSQRKRGGTDMLNLPPWRHSLTPPRKHNQIPLLTSIRWRRTRRVGGSDLAILEGKMSRSQALLPMVGGVGASSKPFSSAHLRRRLARFSNRAYDPRVKSATSDKVFFKLHDLFLQCFLRNVGHLLNLTGRLHSLLI
jgi:hypothetical protein